MLKIRPTKSPEVVDNDLGELKQTVREIQTDMRLLQVEWEETHRKITNTLRSLARSGGKKAPQDEEVLPAAAVPSGADQISAAIHARRSRALPNTLAETGG